MTLSAICLIAAAAGSLATPAAQALFDREGFEPLAGRVPWWKRGQR